MLAIRVDERGGPEVLKVVETDDLTAGPDDLIVLVEAAGVNFIDTYQRSGLYELPLPFVPGSEGAGTVLSVGANVAGHRIGDRVAWAAAIGSYAEQVSVPAAMAVPVPDGIELDTAAATMLQGMTAHYLVNDTYPLRPEHKCLIHAGAGGVGLLLIQLAKRVGAEVFTTVGSEEKAALARAAGADHVILYRDVDFGDAIRAQAGEKPLHVVYDGVGASTFHQSLALLRTRAMMVTFGNASGPVEPISPLLLSPGSLYLTRPRLWDYITSREELLARAGDLFDAIADASLDIRIGHRFPLAEAAEAHRELEARRTTGKILLMS